MIEGGTRQKPGPKMENERVNLRKMQITQA